MTRPISRSDWQLASGRRDHQTTHFSTRVGLGVLLVSYLDRKEASRKANGGKLTSNMLIPDINTVFHAI